MNPKPPPLRQDCLDFLKEFTGESDRAAVILGAAQLDILLSQHIKALLLPSPTSNDELLDGDRGLGTFSAKINVAYRLGLIDSGMCSGLHLIRKIRNSFAHEAGATSLALGSHRDRVRELVRPFRQHPEFDELIESVGLGEFEESSKVFRAVLSIVVVRMHRRLDTIDGLRSDKTLTFHIQEWVDNRGVENENNEVDQNLPKLAEPTSADKAGS